LRFDLLSLIHQCLEFGIVIAWFAGHRRVPE
jgi:hypothetical protein